MMKKNKEQGMTLNNFLELGCLFVINRQLLEKSDILSSRFACLESNLLKTEKW